MIQAKVIADSIGPFGDRLTTLEVVMPRYILAEFNTHRMLSKNSASSRAIPFSKMVKNVMDNPFIPYAWQVDHKGMQGTEYLDEVQSERSKYVWLEGRDYAVDVARDLNENEVTKQLANRLLEPFMYHKVLVSGTEWENFFNLRCPQYKGKGGDIIWKSWKAMLKEAKEDLDAETYIALENADNLYRLENNEGQADIHMMFLAEAIYDAMNESTPNKLKEGEWHIPYAVDARDENQVKQFSDLKRKGLVKDGWDAQCKISIARCARLSYQTLGDNPEINYEADLKLYEVLSKSGHWSPFEHVAKIMTAKEYSFYSHSRPNTKEFDNGISIVKIGEDCEFSEGWCRNFRGFIQYRELLDK